MFDEMDMLCFLSKLKNLDDGYYARKLWGKSEIPVSQQFLIELIKEIVEQLVTEVIDSIETGQTFQGIEPPKNKL